MNDTERQLRLGLEIESNDDVIKLYGARNFKINQLIGSSDASNIDFELLKDFSIDKADCTEYLNEENKFMILCAPKGTGKTTLNLLWSNKLGKRPNHLSIVKYDSNISPEADDSVSPTSWIRMWKLNILDAIYQKLDIIYKINKSEWEGIYKLARNNNQSYNIIDCIVNTLKKRKMKKVEELVQKRNLKIWLFIDEVDQFFTKSPQNINKVSTLLLACKDLSNLFSNVYIRTTLKPNVWAILASQVTSLATMRDFIVDYRWSSDEIKTMIAKRISSYYHKYCDNDIVTKDDDWYIGLLFDLTTDFDLSDKNVEKRKQNNITKFEPHKTLSLLGIKRPRWVLSLIRQAIIEANKTDSGNKITITHIKKCLANYGRERLLDISAEYKVQCDNLRFIFYAFNRKNSSYKYTKLLTVINEEIVNQQTVKIDGVSDSCNAIQIAKYLYEIGFIEPKNRISKNKVEFWNFVENPLLLNDEGEDVESVAEQFIWEIQPAFRNVLNLDKVITRQN